MESFLPKKRKTRGYCFYGALSQEQSQVDSIGQRLGQCDLCGCSPPGNVTAQVGIFCISVSLETHKS